MVGELVGVITDKVGVYTTSQYLCGGVGHVHASYIVKAAQQPPRFSTVLSIQYQHEETE